MRETARPAFCQAAGKWSRRRVVASVAAAGALPALAACGATGGGAAPSQTKDVSGTVQPLVRGDALERELHQKAFALFQEQHPKIKVDAIDAGDDYDAKTQALLAGGTPPSLWFAGANVGYRYWAAKGMIENFDPLIARDKYDLKQFYDSYLPFHKYNGHYMALPSAFLPWVLYYNKSLFDAAGVKYPTKDWGDKTWTWDRFLEIGKQLTKSDGGKTTQFGIGGVGAAPRFTSMLLGGDWFTDDAYETGWIKKFNGTATEVVDAYQFQADLQQKYHVQGTSQELKDQGLTNNFNGFVNGKVAMHVDHVGRFTALSKAQGLQWGMAAIPIGAAKPRRTLIWADYWTFFTGQKSLDATWELVKFMLGPDGQKFYPIGTGSMSGLKSLAGYWADSKQKDLGLSADELKVPIQGVDVQHVSADNFTINWPDLWDAIKDTVADVLAGKVPAKQGFTGAAGAADAAIQKSLPK